MGKSKKTLPAQFVWFQTYANALEQIPEKDERAKLALAICEYGAFGREPDFGNDWMLAAAFEAMRVNLDNSVKSYVNGKKGGRPKKEQAEVDPGKVRKLAKAMETVYEYEPVPDDQLDEQALHALSQHEEERERIRREVEALEWIS